MNLLAIELYRLRLEISTGWKVGYQRPLVGRYRWILGLGVLKAGWVSPRQTTPSEGVLPAIMRAPRGQSPSRFTRQGRRIIS